jgi:carboxyl-terminal processing protease
VIPLRKRSIDIVRQLSLLSAVIALSLAWSFDSRASVEKTSAQDFAKAKVVDRVILSVIEDYYDPERIDSNKMFRTIMDALQKGIAELKVGYDDKRGSTQIEIVRDKMTLSLSEIDSPWSLSSSVHKVFQFIAGRLTDTEYDFRELEYAAANALLSTLDPHSNALPPDMFDALKMDTAGEFGGLGIKITTDRRPPCNGRLTVVEVFENTPAAEAGIETGDTILRIDDESTVNITTAEAADRLRGVPNTKVKVQIKHQNGKTEDYTITRRMVPIASVKWEMLKDKVGYIKLDAFQENSSAEMKEALEKLHEQDMKGLVIDLRGNPGGLLHIAIAIADDFLSSGTIVTTAGRTEADRTVENASAEGTEPMYPIAVLIDSFSASAAEIMAGALRNHGRAILIGETTFGKGSVQMIDQIPDGGAIKLTSAQYLTPGDISIQAVGVTPDVTFIPVILDKNDIRMRGNAIRFSEADLESHLDRPNARTRSDRSPAIAADLFVPESEAAAERDRFQKCFADEETEETFKTRFEKEAARRLIAAAAGPRIEDLIADARKMIEKDSVQEDKSIEASLKKLGVDWSKNSAKKQIADVATVDSKVVVTTKVLDKIIPGKPFKTKVTVENRTDKPIFRLHAVTESDNFLLTGKEFVFGRLAPKDRRSWTQSISLPETADARVDDMKINFDAETGPIPNPSSVEIKIPEKPSPIIILGWQFQDLKNGDGIFEPGEELKLFVNAKNIGDGAARDAEVELSAKPGIDIAKGLLEIGDLAPGASAAGELNLRVIDKFPLKEAELTLAIREWTKTELGVPSTITLRERTIKLKISGASMPTESCDLAVTVENENASLLESPSLDSPKVASAPTKSVFHSDRKTKDFYRVALSPNRAAWISSKEVTIGGKPAPAFEPYMEVPPKIECKSAAVRRVKDKSVIVTGVATHPSLVRDVIIFVGDKKVLYQPSLTETALNRIEFSGEVPLEDGPNNITIIARHDDKVMGMKSIFVRCDAVK